MEQITIFEVHVAARTQCKRSIRRIAAIHVIKRNLFKVMKERCESIQVRLEVYAKCSFLTFLFLFAVCCSSNIYVE